MDKGRKWWGPSNKIACWNSPPLHPKASMNKEGGVGWRTGTGFQLLGRTVFVSSCLHKSLGGIILWPCHIPQHTTGWLFFFNGAPFRILWLLIGSDLIGRMCCVRLTAVAPKILTVNCRSNSIWIRDASVSLLHLIGGLSLENFMLSASHPAQARLWNTLQLCSKVPYLLLD